MDKAFLVTQLRTRIHEQTEASLRAADDARADARTGAQRALNLAGGLSARSAAALEARQTVASFSPRPLKKGEPIGLGALVEVEGDSGGKTLFLAPVGGGTELTGPEGDGVFQVVTPQSPLGRAVMGKRVGASFEVMLAGEPAEFTITWVS